MTHSAAAATSAFAGVDCNFHNKFDATSESTLDKTKATSSGSTSVKFGMDAKSLAA